MDSVHNYLNPQLNKKSVDKKKIEFLFDYLVNPSLFNENIVVSKFNDYELFVISRDGHESFSVRTASWLAKDDKMILVRVEVVKELLRLEKKR